MIHFPQNWSELQKELWAAQCNFCILTILQDLAGGREEMAESIAEYNWLLHLLSVWTAFQWMWIMRVVLACLAGVERYLALLTI